MRFACGKRFRFGAVAAAVALVAGVAFVVCSQVFPPSGLLGERGESVASASADPEGANVSASGGDEATGLASPGESANEVAQEVLQETTQDADGRNMMAHEVILTFEKGTSEQQARAVVESLGYAFAETLASGSGKLGPTVLARLPLDVDVADAVETLGNQAGVRYAEPDYLAELEPLAADGFDATGGANASDVANARATSPTSGLEGANTAASSDSEAALAYAVNDPEASEQWALDALGAYDAWDVVRTEKAVSVAVIDAGVNLGHEDLVDNIVASYNAASEDDFEDNYSNHGTHVTGIVSAKCNNGKGVAGLSYNAGIVAIDSSYYDAQGKEHLKVSALVKAYEYTIANASKYNIRVVNMSLAGTGPISKSLSDQIDLAEDAGIITICAAGNSTSDATPPYEAWPGDYEKCVSVINVSGAKGSSGAWTYTRSSGSNYGTGKNMSAPGVGIYSTTGTTIGYMYGTKSGTSMASPQVAAVAALVFAANPDLTVNQCKDILYSTATDIGATGFDADYGWGVLNAAAAVKKAKAGGDTHSCTTTVTRQPTCANPGLKHCKCIYCSEEFDEEIPTLAHSYVETVTKEPTCTVPGNTHYACSKCGYEYDEPISAPGHTPGAWHESVAPTLGYSGAEEQLCTVCNEVVGTREVEPLAAWDRLAGSTRYDTAAAISNAYCDGGACEFAIVASGEDFPDALAASYAAGVLGAPIVLTAPQSLSRQAADQIAESGAAQVVVVGGEAAVSADAEAQLCNVEGVSKVTRIAGSDRFETAEAIYEQVGELTAASSRTAILANAWAYPDALCASPVAYSLHAPIFLTNSDFMQQTTASILTSGSFDKVLIVGGSAAVSIQIEEQLANAGLEVVRLAGETRYETSVEIARYALQQGTLVSQTVAVASGGNFPDALVGGALCGKEKSVLLLADTGNLDGNAAMTAFVSDRRSNISRVYIFGGESAVPTELEELLRSL